MEKKTKKKKQNETNLIKTSISLASIGIKSFSSYYYISYISVQVFPQISFFATVVVVVAIFSFYVFFVFCFCPFTMFSCYFFFFHSIRSISLSLAHSIFLLCIFFTFCRLLSTAFQPIICAHLVSSCILSSVQFNMLSVRLESIMRISLLEGWKRNAGPQCTLTRIVPISNHHFLFGCLYQG